MTRLRMFLASTIVGLCSLLAFSGSAAADEYVWARSPWGIGGGPNKPVSAMTNGYGGYYVPRNAYGNNYEGRPITNPTGYIVPAQPTYQQSYQQTYQPRHTFWHRRR